MLSVTSLPVTDSAAWRQERYLVAGAPSEILASTSGKLAGQKSLAA